MMDRQIDSPMPMPLGLVVKKALNSRSTCSGSMPTPQSCTATSTASASRCERILSSRGRSVTGAMASMPFITRLMMTCCSWIRSTCTRGSPDASSTRNNARWLSTSWRNSRMASSMTSLMGSGAGIASVFLASARTRRMTSAARLPSSIMRSTAPRTSSRSGTSRASQRRHAPPLATMAASGWLTSWAIEAVSSPKVVTRVTCASSARTQSLFGLIRADRRGHIGSDAPITEEVAFSVKEWLAAGSQVNRRSVPLCGAVQKIAKRLMCVEQRPVRPPFFGLVIEVSGVIRVGEANLARGRDAVRIEMLRNTGETVVGTGFPKPIRGYFGVVAKPLLALAQRLLGLLPVLDIDARSIPFDDVSDLVAQRYVIDQPPAICSICPPGSGFKLERYPGRQGGAPPLRIPRTIFGMVQRLQALAAEVFHSQTVVLQRTAIDEIDGAVRQSAHDDIRNGVKREPEAFL